MLQKIDHNKYKHILKVTVGRSVRDDKSTLTVVNKGKQSWEGNRADDVAQEVNTQKCESIARLQCKEDKCPQKPYDNRYTVYSLHKSTAMVQLLVS